MSKYYAIQVDGVNREVLATGAIGEYVSLDHFKKQILNVAATGASAGATAQASQSVIEFYEMPDGVSVKSRGDYRNFIGEKRSVETQISVLNETGFIGSTRPLSGITASLVADDKAFRNEFFTPFGPKNRNNSFDRHRNKSKIQIERSLYKQSTTLSSNLDPRYADDIPVEILQQIEKQIAEESFKTKLEDISSISFQRDDGSTTIANFKTDYQTIRELLGVKKYVELNLSIIDQDDPASVSNSKVAINDSDGVTYSLSFTEFKRMVLSVLELVVETHNEKNEALSKILTLPASYNIKEKKDYLRGVGGKSSSTSGGGTRSSGTSSSGSGSGSGSGY